VTLALHKTCSNVFPYSTQVLIVLELMPNGDLKNYLDNLVIRFVPMLFCIPSSIVLIVLIIVLCCSVELMTRYIYLVSS